jgi:FkbM family methyltransferase
MNTNYLRALVPRRLRQRRYLSRLIKDESLYRQLSGDRVELKEFGITVDFENHYFFLKQLLTARLLKRDCSASFCIDNSNRILIRLSNLTYQLRNQEDFYILGEIFRNNIYDFYFPENDPLVVCDIGMHVGFASLFFASKPNVVKVYSFEPIEETYMQALQNISMNPAFGMKIEARNQGLGAKTARFFFKFNPEHPGQTGARDQSSEYMEGARSAQIIECTSVISGIKAENPSARLVLKVDCEGCEYDILAALDRSRILEGIELCIVEWHNHGPQLLVDALRNSGFVVIANRTERDIGLVYGYNVMAWGSPRARTPATDVQSGF